MLLPEPLTAANIVRRYKRFLVDAELEDGRLVTAHCANSGSMMGLLPHRVPVLLSASTDPSRRTAWTLELMRMTESWVGVHTGRTNHLVAEALAHNRIPELSGYSSIKQEAMTTDHARLDFLLQAPGRRDCWVEVKSVTLRQGDGALFPDAVTKRGRNHLRLLQQAAIDKKRAVQLFVVQREDCQWFAPAAAIDPDYTEALLQARAAGVEILVYDCSLTPSEIVIRGSVPQSF
ncbi:DNA/RNA nuclease SfsA [Candidatus Magnetaquicoccus inordinatus]|uniref:DNA/RNA nuclease SfsA n=1 Tax=Candidatus Magnetaquicoccus inordinatus TaxID=2496818 RepID=UPI00102D281D|nr:DNA/RNA nuclease SfsA [Candidatus Magnetaquicoccus inordinatus]